MQPMEEGVFLPTEIWTQVLNFVPDERLLPLRLVSHLFEELVLLQFKQRQPGLYKEGTLRLSYQDSDQKKLSGDFLAALGKENTHIESLTITHTSLLNTASLGMLATRIPNLRTLTFQENNAHSLSKSSYPDLNALSSFTSLTALSFLSPHRFNSEHLSQISSLCLTRLASLQFYLCPNLSGAAIAYFLENTQMTLLKSLHFSKHSEFQPNHLSGLTRLRKLQMLCLNSTVTFGNNFHLLPLKSLPITSLSLAIASLSDTDLAILSTSLKLSRLFISSSRFLSDEGINNLTSLSQLEQLTLDGCRNLSDRTFFYIANISSLAFLSFNRMPLLTDQGLKNISSLPTLKSLSLEGLDGITGEALVSFTALTTLNLSEMKHLTSCPLSLSSSLKKLSLWRCETLPKETLRDYAKKFNLETHPG